MAITVRVLNESNNRVGQIQLDLVLDVLASEDEYPLSTDCEFYFKMNTTSLQVGGGSIPVKVTKSLSDLALNGAKQSRTNVATDYTSVTDMVEDYIFDFTHGHTADQYTSGCTAQGAMSI